LLLFAKPILSLSHQSPQTAKLHSTYTPEMSYEQIKSAATTFILANNPLQEGTNEPNIEKLRSTSASTFSISFGHSYFTSTRPALQSTHDFDGFIAHQKKMTPLLSTWKAEVKDVYVDVERKTAIVTSEFHMTPRMKESSKSETVVNEIVWFLEVDEEGLVTKATEWVDAAAAGRLGELFKLNAS
jgi:hypothetical protein